VTLAARAREGRHITIGDNVTVGGKSGVAKSVPAGQVVSGYPAMPHSLWLRSSMIIPRLPEMEKKIRMLEKRIAGLEKERERDGGDI